MEIVNSRVYFLCRTKERMSSDGAPFVLQEAITVPESSSVTSCVVLVFQEGMLEGVSRRAFGGSSGTYNVRASELARHKALKTLRVQVALLDDSTQVFEIEVIQSPPPTPLCIFCTPQTLMYSFSSLVLQCTDLL